MELPMKALSVCGNSHMVATRDILRGAATVRPMTQTVGSHHSKQSGSSFPNAGALGLASFSRKALPSPGVHVALEECGPCRFGRGTGLDGSGVLSCGDCCYSLQRRENHAGGVCMSMSNASSGKGGLPGAYGQDGRVFSQNGALNGALNGAANGALNGAFSGSVNGAITALQHPPELADTIAEERNAALREDFDMLQLDSPFPSTGYRLNDGFMYRERFVVRSYEVGVSRTASMETIAKLFQEVGCNHAQSVGFSTDGFATTPGMRKQGLIWVTTRMHIEMAEYPIWGEVVEIDTWFQGEGRVGARRDWIIKKVSTGEIIGRGTSTWVMMNTATRRLARITEDVRAEYEQFCPTPPRYAFPEGKREVKKIPKLEEPPQCCSSDLQARRGDLDMNQHVNNVTYINWMLESIPEQTWESHELVGITLEYRCECHLGDAVESTASLESVDLQRRASREAREAAARRASAAVSAGPFGSSGHSPVPPVVGYKPFYSSSLVNLSDWWLEGGLKRRDNVSLLENSQDKVKAVEVADSKGAVAEKDLEQYVHFLRLQPGHGGEGKELNRGRTVWRRTHCPLPQM